jgi:hypothetical protein
MEVARRPPGAVIQPLEDPQRPQNDGPDRFRQMLQPEPRDGLYDLTPRIPDSQKQKIYVVDEYGGRDAGPTGYHPVVGHGDVLNAYIGAKTGLKTLPVDVFVRGTSVAPTMLLIAKEIDKIRESNAGNMKNVYISMSLAFSKEMAEANPIEYKTMTDAISRLIALGGNVIVGAGNDFPSELLKVPGIVGIGSSTDKLAGNPEIDYRFPSNEITITKLTSGYDVNGDGKTDIYSLDGLREGTQFKFGGTSESTALATIFFVMTGVKPVDRN